MLHDESFAGDGGTEKGRRVRAEEVAEEWLPEAEDCDRTSWKPREGIRTRSEPAPPCSADTKPEPRIYRQHTAYRNGMGEAVDVGGRHLNPSKTAPKDAHGKPLDHQPQMEGVRYPVINKT